MVPAGFESLQVSASRNRVHENGVGGPLMTFPTSATLTKTVFSLSEIYDEVAGGPATAVTLRAISVPAHVPANESAAVALGLEVDSLVSVWTGGLPRAAALASASIATLPKSARVIDAHLAPAEKSREQCAILFSLRASKVLRHHGTMKSLPELGSFALIPEALSLTSSKLVPLASKGL